MFQNLREITCARVSFVIKLQALSLHHYLETDSGTGVACKLLRNLFYKLPPRDFFNPYHIASLFLYLLKILENLFFMFSGGINKDQ